MPPAVRCALVVPERISTDEYMSGSMKSRPMPKLPSCARLLIGARPTASGISMPSTSSPTRLPSTPRMLKPVVPPRS
ncbi:hypothetical protein ASF94_18870 [Acidovorax sp. Leaf160]|nr:hypothetical protein ASF94_18870 [Acidovorax sp. Leaf160]